MLDKLLEDIQDKNIPISNLLRRAKVLANRLDETEFLKWIDLELSGYGKNGNCPSYRKLHGEVKAWNPYHGWIPVMTGNSEVANIISNRHTPQSVNEIEELLRGNSSDFAMPFPDHVAAQILADAPFKTKVSLFIGRASLVGTLNGIRNKLFDWLLKLDKEGVKVDEEPVQKVAARASALSFDEQRSVLSLNDEAITISRSKDSDPHYLLTIIFRDKKKVWQYDELWEDTYFRSHEGFYDPAKDWRKVYNAAYSVNEKVAKKTMIDDFLVVTKTSVTINKKYL